MVAKALSFVFANKYSLNVLLGMLSSIFPFDFVFESLIFSPKFSISLELCVILDTARLKLKMFHKSSFFLSHATN